MATLKAPRIRYLGKIAGLKVYLVSGRQVRNELDIDFTMGGNEAVYPSYVPRGEIWIDDAADALDRTATCLHEIVERHQMMKNGLSYDAAHEIASAHERPFRRELARRPPKTFDAGKVSAAYRAYLRAPTRYPIIDRPNDNLPSRSQKLQRDIEAAIGRKV